MAVTRGIQPTQMIELLAKAFTKVPPVPTAGPPIKGWSEFRRPCSIRIQTLHYTNCSTPSTLCPTPRGARPEWCYLPGMEAVQLPDAWREATLVPLLKPGKH
ncbi:hypothetical protein HPB47_003742 [Ixodes persulcatus]|uniref:Uncharacterized protein n=1 Tax=Ixodes persulcatus TaxID=34615 RepID=A0AC60PHN5_IXOPE|nr:hypothetical protein HPB47_003742 [Ixodes persulcatus]